MLEMITAADDFVRSVGENVKQTDNEVAGPESAIDGLRQKIAAAENSPLRHLIDNAAIDKDRQDLAALEAQLDRILLKRNASNEALRRQAESESMAALEAYRNPPSLPPASPPASTGGTGGGGSAAKSRAEPYDLLADAAGRASDSVSRLSDQEQIAFDRAQLIGRTASDALSAILVRGEKASDVLQGLANPFTEAAIEAAALRMVSAFLGAFGGGAAAPFRASGGMGKSFYGTGSVFHSGGVMGSTKVPKRLVPAAAFANAPRMHDGGFAGLKVGEVPAILQKGEYVVPREMVGRPQNAPRELTVNVTVNGARGNTEIRQMVAEGVGQGITAYDRGQQRRQMAAG